MKKEGSFIRRLLSSRLFLLLLLALSIIFLVGFSRAFWRDYQIRKEINNLIREKEEMDITRFKLLDKINDIKSADFAEKEARLKFGLGQPGESLMIISERQTAEEQPVQPIKKEEKKSNPLRWWRFFFNGGQ